MAYRSSTLRKKLRSKGKVTKLDDTCSIYSTLSKKPADLETTDIDLSAIRIFLGDGSHRTLSSTPSTTCGMILDRLLEKLGLSEQRENYGLQIHYKYAEPRIPNDAEVISELNIHTWDSVDKIFLYKKSSTFVMMPLRKRVASYARQSSDNSYEEENIYENCAVSLGYCRVSEYDTSVDLNPVLVNDKLASKFARAWSVASDASAQEDKETVPIETPTQLTLLEQRLGSPNSGNGHTYTLDRRHKKGTLRRQTPLTPHSRPEMPTPPVQMTPNQGHLQNSPECASSRDRYKPNHFKLPIKSPEGPSKPSTISFGSLCMSPDISISDGDLSSSFSSQDISLRLLQNPLHKSMSEGCLLSACDSDKADFQRSPSIEILRDSGFHDSSPTRSGVNQPRRGRRKSVSLDDIPKEVVKPLDNHSQSVPSLALHSRKAHPKMNSTDESDDDVFMGTTVNASSLKSSRSMELLSGDDFNAIKENLNQQTANTATEANRPPLIPKRDSSFLDNCTVPDDYLLKQGKRLSQVMNIEAALKSEGKGPIRSFFQKVGTMLTGKKRSQSSMSPVSLLSPQSPRPKMALFNSPGQSPRIPCPFPHGAHSYSPSSHTAILQNSSKTSVGSAADEEHFDIVVAESKQKTNMCSTQSLDRKVQSNINNASSFHTQSLDRHLPKRLSSDYDIAVLHPIVPAKSPVPNYLQLMSPELPMPSIYENFEMSEADPESFYQTPPPRTDNHQSHDDEADSYQNHYIKGGANGSITLDGSMLHDYQVPPPLHSLPNTTEESSEIYKNNSIKSGAKGAITLNDRKLHDYQFPPSRAFMHFGCTGKNLSEAPPELPPRPNHLSKPGIEKKELTLLEKPSGLHNLTYPPRRGSNFSGYRESITDWVVDIYDDLEEIYDDILPQTQSEPEMLYEDIEDFYGSVNEDEYMTMHPLSTEALCLETSKPLNGRSRSSKLLKGRPCAHVPERCPVSVKDKSVTDTFLQAELKKHISRPLVKKASFGPSLTLGAPPAFIPTAPKPKLHKLKHASTESLDSLGSVKKEEPKPLLIKTLPRNDSLDDDTCKTVRSPPPNTLQFKKEPPQKKKFSPFASTPFLSPPPGFSGSRNSTPTVVKKPIWPPGHSPAITPLPPPLVTPSSPQDKPLTSLPERVDSTISRLIPPQSKLPSTPPPKLLPPATLPTSPISPPALFRIPKVSKLPPTPPPKPMPNSPTSPGSLSSFAVSLSSIAVKLEEPNSAAIQPISSRPLPSPPVQGRPLPSLPEKSSTESTFTLPAAKTLCTKSLTKSSPLLPQESSTQIPPPPPPPPPPPTFSTLPIKLPQSGFQGQHVTKPLPLTPPAKLQAETPPLGQSPISEKPNEIPFTLPAVKPLLTKPPTKPLPLVPQKSSTQIPPPPPPPPLPPPTVSPHPPPPLLQDPRSGFKRRHGTKPLPIPPPAKPKDGTSSVGLLSQLHSQVFSNPAPTATCPPPPLGPLPPNVCVRDGGGGPPQPPAGHLAHKPGPPNLQPSSPLALPPPPGPPPPQGLHKLPVKQPLLPPAGSLLPGPQPPQAFPPLAPPLPLVPPPPPNPSAQKGFHSQPAKQPLLPPASPDPPSPRGPPPRQASSPLAPPPPPGPPTPRGLHSLSAKKTLPPAVGSSSASRPFGSMPLSSTDPTIPKAKSPTVDFNSELLGKLKARAQH